MSSNYLTADNGVSSGVTGLGTRPFQEVFQLIQEVQKEAQAQQPESPTNP